MSKLTREDKIEIYERKLKGETTSSIAKSFNVRKSAIKYLIALIKKHGYDISRSPNLEQINHMLNLAFKENENYENLIFHSDQECELHP